MADRPEPARRRLTLAGALVVGLPVALFVASLLYLGRGGAAVAPGGPGAAADGGTVPGWVGALDGPGGTRVLARLARLHPAELRQGFDREALARKLELGPGEPWRLVLRLIGPVEGPAGLAELRLDALEVTDGGGPALRPIRASSDAEPAGVADPLAVLLAPPELLHAGEEASLVLWGRAPAAAGSTLDGLDLRPGPEAGASALSLPLEERSLAPGPEESALASLEVFARSDAPDQDPAGGASER